MKEPSYYKMHRLNIPDWLDAPEEYNYWGAGDPMEYLIGAFYNN